MRHFKKQNSKFSPRHHLIKGPAIMFFRGPAVSLDVPPTNNLKVYNYIRADTNHSSPTVQNMYMYVDIL